MDSFSRARVFFDFFGVFFGLLLPKMVKLQDKQKKMRAEEKLLKEQNKTALEIEKLGRDLTKQKMTRRVEAEIDKLQPKFCQYCDAKIPAEGVSCLFCGARLQRDK